MVSVLLVMLGMLSGCAQGPQGIPPITLEHAKQLEATDPKKAVEEYMAVHSQFDGKDNETAAQALLDAAVFGSDGTRYILPAQREAAKTPDTRQKLQDDILEGRTSARQALKQLEQHYPTSKAYLTASSAKMLESVEKSIDDTNSKTIQYKIVDFLVRLTGSHPDFSYWFALVLIAVFIKVVTFPLLLKTYKSQREMQKIQPILKEIQAKYKENPTEMQSKTMAAYKEHGVNPFASCLPSLVQIPIFWGMFALVRAYEIHFTNGHFLWINPAVAHSVIGQKLGISPDLAHLDMPILLLYAASMYISMKLAPSPDPQMAAQQRQMSVMMTGMMIYWFMVTKWSSAFLLYYLVQNILSTWQQYVYIYKPNKLNAANNPPVPPSSANPSAKGSGASTTSPGVRDVTFVEEKPGNGAYRADGSGASNNRPRPKRKTRR